MEWFWRCYILAQLGGVKGDSGKLEKIGRDERIRTSDPLNPIHTKKQAIIGFQQLTPCTERNNAEESRNFRNQIFVVCLRLKLHPPQQVVEARVVKAMVLLSGLH